MVVRDHHYRIMLSKIVLTLHIRGETVLLRLVMIGLLQEKTVVLKVKALVLLLVGWKLQSGRVDLLEVWSSQVLHVAVLDKELVGKLVLLRRLLSLMVIVLRRRSFLRELRMPIEPVVVFTFLMIPGSFFWVALAKAEHLVVSMWVLVIISVHADGLQVEAQSLVILLEFILVVRCSSIWVRIGLLWLRV